MPRYSTQTTPSFLRWTPVTVPTSTPVGYGTWTLVPMSGLLAQPPPPLCGGGFVFGVGVVFGVGLVFLAGRGVCFEGRACLLLGGGGLLHPSSDSKCHLDVFLSTVLVT